MRITVFPQSTIINRQSSIDNYSPFSEQKMVYNAENGTVIYRSRMHAKTKRNFEIFSAEEFIAAITQHIPDKGFQMVRYYPVTTLSRATVSRVGRGNVASRGNGTHVATLSPPWPSPHPSRPKS